LVYRISVRSTIQAELKSGLLQFWWAKTALENRRFWRFSESPWKWHRVISNLALIATLFFSGGVRPDCPLSRGAGGRSPSFGFELSTFVDDATASRSGVARSSFKATYRAEFIRSVAQPTANRITISSGQFRLDISELNKGSPSVKLYIRSWEGELPKEITDEITPYLAFDTGARSVLMMLAFATRRKELTSNDVFPEPVRTEIHTFEALWERALRTLGPPPLATAPVRTRPERTYNPIEERRTSEGAHVPMVMAKTYFTNREKWTTLQSSLNRFGKASGLYEQISLKPLGRSSSDPFQIMVKLAGPRSNMVDVGYGVSQVLPILVDLVTTDSPRNYLLQQPEIHLHPRGQAELASFLGSMVKTTGNWTVIETHSDYIIDRLRTDIRNGVHLCPEDVSLLFLERLGVETMIHQIHIDKEGNLEGVPSAYRKFTLEEEKKFLGIDEGELDGDLLF
jgi:hypothetical protein